MTPLNQTKPTIEPEYVNLPVDHFGDHPGTFKNRFWVSEVDYKPGGPVFVYDVGEANASASAVARLTNETSFFKQMVQQFNGIGIVWEHRYYGGSAPVNVSLHTPASDFEWLSTEQALADVPTFAWNFSRTNLPGADLTPKSTPWVFVGGSYPGMRAAFMRKFYPGTVFASYASSAPVQAAIDMSFYFEPIWKGMRAYGWSNCTEDIKAAVVAMDMIMEDDDASFKLKEKFLGPMAGNNTNGGFADALATIFFLWQSYGVDGGKLGLRSFCDHISRDPATNKTSDEAGWAAVKGANFTIDRWASWPFFPLTVNENMFTKCIGSRKWNSTKVANCNLQERFPESAAISWAWQYCTQWGFLQSANEGEHQLVSKFNSLEHQAEICHRQFPDGLESGLLGAWPYVDTTNARYGGWNLRPSNTFWTGGEFDPWRTLSPLSDMPFSPRFKTISTIPDCGSDHLGEQSPLFGYLVPDGEHAYDFRTNLNSTAPARKLFTDALTKWLECHKPAASNVTVDSGGEWGEGHFSPGAAEHGRARRFRVVDGMKLANYP
jgi:hypothetical protein